MKRISDLKSSRKTVFVFRSGKTGYNIAQASDPTVSTTTFVTTTTTGATQSGLMSKPF
jgi:hypothetical protein